MGIRGHAGKAHMEILDNNEYVGIGHTINYFFRINLEWMSIEM